MPITWIDGGKYLSIDFVSVITLEHGMCTVSLVIYLVKSVQQ